MLSIQQFSGSLFFGFTEFFNGDPSIRPTNNGAKGNQEDIR